MQQTSIGLEVFRTLVQLVQALIWPALVVLVLLTLKEPVTRLLDRANQTSLKVPGVFELTMNKVAESAAAAGVALGKQAASENKTVEAAAVENIARAVVARGGPSGYISERKILWVDDLPINNTNLADAFRALGIEVIELPSTEDALKRVAATTYDLIITDMGRPEGGEAGLELIKALRERGLQVPVIIYAANWARGHRGQEERFGVTRITNDPGVVYATALSALRGQ